MKYPEEVRKSSPDKDQGSSVGEFQAGQIVGDRYEVISLLGRGGMGLVYKVRQIYLDREFALKTIVKSSMSEVVIRRFQQEARAAFLLDHPSIIAVKDFGLLSDNTPFLAMELLNGESLGDRLKRTGRLPLEEAIPIFVQVCFGLAYAHECGIVHRDIKPGNIMIIKNLPLGVEGSVKVVDFGIAKLLGHEGGEIQALTRTGEIFGSPLYMSPEQCGGLKVDSRSDVYSLGCVLFEALTGTPPFMGDNALSTMMKHQKEQPPSLKEATLGDDFPKGIEDIVATMLAKAPERRYRDLGVAANDLGALKRGAAISPVAQLTCKQERDDTEKKEKFVPMSRNKLGGIVATAFLMGACLASIANYLLVHSQNGKASQLAVERDAFSSDTTGGVSRKVEDSLDDIQKLLNNAQRTHRLNASYRNLSDKAIELIANTPEIENIDFIESDLPNESLYKLAKLKKLGNINLNDTNFDDAGAEGLSHCESLVRLYANGTHVTDKGVRKLAACKSLGFLRIGGTRVTDQGLITLSGIERLWSLDARSLRGITNKGLGSLANSKIRRLCLMHSSVDSQGFQSIARMPLLKRVDLSGTQVTFNDIDKICRKKSMEEVILAECPAISAEQVRLLKLRFPKIRFDTGGSIGVPWARSESQRD